MRRLEGSEQVREVKRTRVEWVTFQRCRDAEEWQIQTKEFESSLEGLESPFLRDFRKEKSKIMLWLPGESNKSCLLASFVIEFSLSFLFFLSLRSD